MQSTVGSKVRLSTACSDRCPSNACMHALLASTRTKGTNRLSISQGLTPHLTIGAGRAAEKAYATALQWGSSYKWATYKAGSLSSGLCECLLD